MRFIPAVSPVRIQVPLPKDAAYRHPAASFFWPVGQVVKTPPFHGGNMGSSPVRVTKKERESDPDSLSFFMPRLRRGTIRGAQTRNGTPVPSRAHPVPTWHLVWTPSSVLYQNKQIRTKSSQSEMGSDLAFSSGNFLPRSASRESAEKHKEDLL